MQFLLFFQLKFSFGEYSRPLTYWPQTFEQQCKAYWKSEDLNEIYYFDEKDLKFTKKLFK